MLEQQRRQRLGSVSVELVTGARADGFYRVTIMLSQTPGTALGDYTADSARLGYTCGVAIFV